MDSMKQALAPHLNELGVEHWEWESRNGFNGEMFIYDNHARWVVNNKPSVYRAIRYTADTADTNEAGQWLTLGQAQRIIAQHFTAQLIDEPSQFFKRVA
jgi:hypothetical protein